MAPLREAMIILYGYRLYSASTGFRSVIANQ